MYVRLLQSLFAALVVIVLIAVPVLALRPAAPAAAPLLPSVSEQVAPEDEEVALGSCNGLQRAYWAVTSNPGKGDEKAQAAADLASMAVDRGCELSNAAPNWPAGPPPWVGQGNKGNGEGNRGRGSPPWASEGDGPPWGLAWGRWLKHGGEGVCERIAARLDALPDATVPEDLRQRLQDELGCDLP